MDTAGVTRGAGEGGRPRAQVKKGAQNEPTGIYFDIFGGQMVHKVGAKIRFQL